MQAACLQSFRRLTQGGHLFDVTGKRILDDFFGCTYRNRFDESA
jgi:hypothetical protein